MDEVKFNNRLVIGIELDGIDSGDYPDFCDAYICAAMWDDTGKELTEDELEALSSENGMLINELAHESFH